MNKKDMVKIGLVVILALIAYNYVVSPVADKIAEKMKS
jgi:hypothetical protein